MAAGGISGARPGMEQGTAPGLFRPCFPHLNGPNRNVSHRAWPPRPVILGPPATGPTPSGHTHWFCQGAGGASWVAPPSCCYVHRVHRTLIIEAETLC